VRQKSVFATTALVASLLPRSARAEPGDAAPPLDLTWDAPASCPTSADVVAEVGRLTHVPSTGGEGRRRLAAIGRVEKVERGQFRLVLETVLGDARDTKTIVGDSCETLAGSAAVVLALRLDASEESESAAAPLPAGPPPTPKARPSPPPAKPSPRVAPTFWIGLGGALDTSALPELALGGALHIAFQFERVHVSATAVYWVPRDQALEGGGSATFGWQTVAVAAGFDLLGGPWHLGPSAGLEMGAMSAESFGVRAPGSATELWVAALGGAHSALDLARNVRIVLDAMASVPLRRPDFVIEGRGPVHRPAPLGGRIFLGAEWGF
jgi:hypothetical protein